MLTIKYSFKFIIKIVIENQVSNKFLTFYQLFLLLKNSLLKNFQKLNINIFSYNFVPVYELKRIQHGP